MDSAGPRACSQVGCWYAGGLTTEMVCLACGAATVELGWADPPSSPPPSGDPPIPPPREPGGERTGRALSTGSSGRRRRIRVRRRRRRQS